MLNVQFDHERRQTPQSVVDDGESARTAALELASPRVGPAKVRRIRDNGSRRRGSSTSCFNWLSISMCRGTFVAITYAGLDDRNQALAWLEKAYEERDQWLCQLKVEPMLDRLRGERRFQNLLARVFPVS